MVWQMCLRSVQCATLGYRRINNTFENISAEHRRYEDWARPWHEYPTHGATLTPLNGHLEWHEYTATGNAARVPPMQ